MAERDAQLQAVCAETTSLVEQKELLVSQVLQKEKDLGELDELKSSLEASLADISGFKSRLETELIAATTQVNNQAKLIEEQAAQAQADCVVISTLQMAAQARQTEFVGMKDKLIVMTVAADEATAQSLNLGYRLAELTGKLQDKTAKADVLEGEVRVSPALRSSHPRPTIQLSSSQTDACSRHPRHTLPGSPPVHFPPRLCDRERPGRR